MTLSFLKEYLRILIKPKIYLLVFLTITVAILILAINIKISLAGGARPYCSKVEFNDFCFSKENSKYLIPSFINKEKNDNRYKTERKWEVIINENENFDYSSYDFNYNFEDETKRIREELKKIKDTNIFLNNFLKVYKYENRWCNNKILKALKFSTEIEKHFPNKEKAKRLSAARILFSGNFCFQKINDNSEWPKNYSLKEIFPEFEKIMSPLNNYELSNEEKDLYTPWLNYFFGAISYNEALDFQGPSNEFNYFQNKNLSQSNLGGYPSWIVEATNYMYLLVKAKKIRSEQKVSLIDDWLKNYTKFLINFPQSEFNNHLKNIEFGIHKLNGDYANFVNLYSNELTKSLTKIEDKKNLDWLDKLNLRSVPLIFSEKINYTLPKNSHPKLKLLQLLTLTNSLIKSNNICKEKYDVPKSDPQLYFNKICDYLVSNQYPDNKGFESNWYKIQSSYLGVNLAIKENNFDEAKKLMAFQKEFIDESAEFLLINELFFQKIKNQELEKYFENDFSNLIQHFDHLKLNELAIYQLKVYSKFLSKEDDLINIYLSLKNPNYRFSIILPHLEQALLYGDKSNLRTMLNQINFKKINIPSKNRKVIKLLSLKNKLNLKYNNSLLNSEIGNYIYREEIIPACYQMPPKPIEVKTISGECGYFLINEDKETFEFISKSHSNIGLVPINIFKQSLNEIKYNKSFELEKYNLLKRMIYCMKGFNRRFNCIRNVDIKKTEPIKWFKELNKGKERQKYWYYEESYYDINNWPFFSSEDKMNKERIWQY